MVQAGSIKEISGSVSARTSQGQVRELNVGDLVYENELIETSAGSSVTIELDNGKTINLSENAQILIDESVIGVVDVRDAVVGEAESMQAALEAGEDITDAEEEIALGEEDDGFDYALPYYAGDQTRGEVGSYLFGTEYGSAEEVIPEENGEIEEVPVVPPTISISDAEPVYEPEGDGPSVYVTFTVTLSAASTETVTVDFTTADGTAIAGGPGADEYDYGQTSGTVTFAPGETSQTITVQILVDYVDEPIENFYINLSNPANATIADDQGIGTILDNDATPEVSIAVDPADASGVVEGGTINFIVSQDAVSDSDTVVDVDLAAGTATAGADYTDGSTYQVTIPAGLLTATVTVDVPTIDDDADEPSPENFTANITNAVNATGVTIGTPTAIGLILDNDATPEVSIAVDPADASGVVEGGTINFIVSQDAVSYSDTVVDVDLAAGTATAGADYTDGSTYQVTIPAGLLTATVTVDVPTIDDDADEPSPENFTANITNAVNATGVTIGTPTAIGLILDNDATPEVSIAVDPADASGVVEGGTINFIVSQDAVSYYDTVVDVDLAAGTATAGADYTDGSTYQVTIPAGLLTATVTVDVPTIDDDADEPSPENFTANITNAVNATGVTIGTPTAIGLIVDNDAEPQVHINVDQADAGGVTEGGTINFIVTQDEISDSDTTVTVNLTPGTADPVDDYTDSSPYTVTIFAGQTTANLTVDVPTVDDDADEPSPEDFTATITSAVNATGVTIGTPTAIGLIVDNDAEPQVHINVDQADAGGVTEGGTINFIVTQDEISDSDTTVTVNLTPGTADPVDDYTDSSPYTVTIFAGQTTANLTVDVPTVDDDADEPSPEDFTATITSAVNATGVTIGTPTAIGEILDNDEFAVGDTVSDDDDAGENTYPSPIITSHTGDITTIGTGLSLEIVDGATGLESNGIAIATVWDDGTKTLTGSAGSVVVFTIVVSGSSYTFTQFEAIDHPDGLGENDLGVTFTAQVVDGATVVSSDPFTVTINDSIIHNLEDVSITLPNLSGELSAGDLPGIIMSEDSPTGVAWDTDNMPVLIYGNNIPVDFIDIGGTLVGFTQGGVVTPNVNAPGGFDVAGGTLVFTATIYMPADTSTPTYDFNLINGPIGGSETITFQYEGQTPGNYPDDYTFVHSVGGLINTITSVDSVNVSTQGIGAGSNWMNGGQSIKMTLSDDNGTPSIPGDDTPAQLTNFSFTVDGDSSYEVAWVAQGELTAGGLGYFTSWGDSGTGVYIPGSETYMLEANETQISFDLASHGSGFDYFYSVEIFCGDDKFRVESASIETQSDIENQHFDLPYTLTDADGDIAIAELSVHLDSDPESGVDDYDLTTGDDFDNSFDFSNAAAMDGLHYDGKGGIDTLNISETSATLDFSNVDNVEKIDLNATEAQIVTLSLDDVLDMTDSDNVLEITGGTGDVVTLTGLGANPGEWTQSDTVDGLFTQNDSGGLTVTIVSPDEPDNNVTIVPDIDV